MAGLPTGTVTFLFTDIEGSTRLLKDLGDLVGLIEHTEPLEDCTSIVRLKLYIDN